MIHVMTKALLRVRISRAALLDSAARFRALAEAIREGVVIHDGGRITDANETFRRMRGCISMNEVIERNIMDLIAPEGRGIIAGRVANAYSGAYKGFGICADGGRFPNEIEGLACCRFDGRSV